MKKLKKSAFVSLIVFILLLSSQTVLAVDIYVYPSETPTTTSDDKFNLPYTNVTVNVEPKVDQIIQGSGQTWTITITYKVTVAGDGKVNKAGVRILQVIWDNTLPGSLVNTQGDIVEGPTVVPGNKWDVNVSLSSGYFDEGTVFTLTFDMTVPPTLTPGQYELVKVFHRSQGSFSGQESTSDDAIIVVFDVIPTPRIPEIPGGTFSVLLVLIVSIAIISRHKKLNLPM